MTTGPERFTEIDPRRDISPSSRPRYDGGMKPSPLLVVMATLVLSCLGCGGADTQVTCSDGSFATDGSGDCIPWTVCAVGSVATPAAPRTSSR